MPNRIDVRQLPDHEVRLSAARQRAYYELGDSSWADKIIDAYLDPDGDCDRLNEEMK